MYIIRWYNFRGPPPAFPNFNTMMAIISYCEIRMVETELPLEMMLFDSDGCVHVLNVANGKNISFNFTIN